MLGVRDGAAAAETLHLAGDQELGADRHLALAVELEEHQFGETGAVGYHDTPGLAGVGGGLDAHHLDFEGDDLAGLRSGDGGALAAIEVPLGEVEQQVDHAIAAGHLGDQRGGRRTDAFQRGEGRKQGCEEIMFHGLTGGNRAAI